MLGDPSLNDEQLYSLANVFRMHIEGVARLSDKSISKEIARETRQFMKRSVTKSKELGINARLIRKAIKLGIEAAKNY